MPDRLIDTNILVYAYDTSEGAKHDFAKNIVKQIWQDGGGKVTSPISVADAKIIIDDMTKSDSWRVIDRDINTFLKAIDIVSQYSVHLWDATIIGSFPRIPFRLIFSIQMLNSTKTA
jgi:predicted nucleic acid-binding protein